MYPELWFLLDAEHWYRCLTSEALAVMAMGDNFARANRGPWGLAKILRSTADSVKEAVKFICQHLFVWVPIQVAVNVIQAHLRGQEISRSNMIKYRVEVPEKGDESGFSFFLRKRKVQTTALARLQPHFPAVGHLFRTGAVHQNVAEKFVRGVTLQINTELPIFKPELDRFAGGTPPREHMPCVWANDSNEMLIHKQLMEPTVQQFDDECQDRFRRHPPVCIQNVEHNGFVQTTKHPEHIFNDNPEELLNSDMIEALTTQRQTRKRTIDPVELANAKAKAAKETGEPAPTNQT